MTATEQADDYAGWYAGWLTHLAQVAYKAGDGWWKAMDADELVEWPDAWPEDNDGAYPDIREYWRTMAAAVEDAVLARPEQAHNRRCAAVLEVVNTLLESGQYGEARRAVARALALGKEGPP